jgi:hypothetical protein
MKVFPKNIEIRGKRDLERSQRVLAKNNSSDGNDSLKSIKSKKKSKRKSNFEQEQMTMESKSMDTTTSTDDIVVMENEQQDRIKESITRPGITIQRIDNFFDSFVTGIAIRP